MVGIVRGDADLHETICRCGTKDLGHEVSTFHDQGTDGIYAHDQSASVHRVIISSLPDPFHPITKSPVLSCSMIIDLIVLDPIGSDLVASHSAADLLTSLVLALLGRKFELVCPESCGDQLQRC